MPRTIWRHLTPLRNTLHRSTRQQPTRQQSTYQPPDGPTTQARSASNPHRDFYRVYGRAWAKTFLLAVVTYQAIYWSWKKLESIEVKRDTESEIRGLEGELRELVGRKEKR